MIVDPSETTGTFRAITASNIAGMPVWGRIPAELREAIRVVSRVLPFRTNEYVIRELINWSRVPDDPMFQLTFPQRAMLDPADYAEVRDLVNRAAPREELLQVANRIRLAMNPHPGGQREYNVPRSGGAELPRSAAQVSRDRAVLPRPGADLPRLLHLLLPLGTVRRSPRASASAPRRPRTWRPTCGSTPRSRTC